LLLVKSHRRGTTDTDGWFAPTVTPDHHLFD
jgi:hypothetical protein